VVLWPQRDCALPHPSIHPYILTSDVDSCVREEEEDEAAHFLGGPAPVGGDGGEDGGEEGSGHFTGRGKEGREERREGRLIAEQRVNVCRGESTEKRRVSSREIETEGIAIQTYP